MAYVVTDGSSQKTFTYLIDANNFLNANSDWYFVVSGAASGWQIAKTQDYPFSGVENLTIEHDAGRDVAVVVYDEDGNQTPCATSQVDENTVYVEWVGAMTGRAVVTAGFEQ